MTSLHADEAFLGHYQLSHDPFAPRVPGFKFFPAQRKPVLGQLHHLARYSQLLLVVTGPHGSGKTLLRQALVASTNKQSVQSVVVSARGAGDAAGVLRQIAQGLTVPQAEVRTLLSQVVQMALIGQEVYILVDDAEQLDESALEALLALAAGTPEGRPHVFLFGEASLIPRMERVSVEEERFHVIELVPYSEEETREYLAQRLEGAGKGIELLTNTQISDIHEHSDGWPGTINQVARDNMIEAMLASRTAVKRPGFSFNVPKKHLVALVVIGVAVVAAFLMQGRTSSPPAVVTDANNAAPVAASGTALPLGQAAPAPTAKPQSNAGDAPSPAPQAKSPAIEFAGNSQPMPLPMVGKSQPVIRGNLAEQAGADQGGSEEPPPGDDEDAGGKAASNDTGVSRPPVVTTSAPPLAVPAQAPVVTAPRPAAPAPAAKPAVAKAQPPAPVAKPAAKPAPAAAPAVTNGAGWYAAQPGTHYVVQILGTSAEATAKGFVHEQGGEYRYFKKTLQGKPLYVVTYGNFADRAAALAAMKELPAKVLAGKPWPRTVASIQQDLSGH